MSIMLSLYFNALQSSISDRRWNPLPLFWPNIGKGECRALAWDPDSNCKFTLANVECGLRDRSSPSTSPLDQSRPRMGLCCQDTVRAGTFWRFLKISLCASGAQLRLDIVAKIQIWHFPPKLFPTTLLGVLSFKSSSLSSPISNSSNSS